AGGDHHVRAGASVRHVTVDRELLALPPVAETVYGLPARVWIPQAPTSPSRRRLTTVALFAADEMALASDVSVQAGIRLDITTGAAVGAARGIRWTSVSPRASFRWHPGPV